MSDDTAISSLAETFTGPGDTSNPDTANTPADTLADTQAPASPSTGDTDTKAPPASPAPRDERAELLAVVQDAIKPKVAPENPGGEGNADKPGDQTNLDPKTEADPNAQAEVDPTDDELKALAPKTRKRVEKLLKQRGEARAEVETLKPAAALWQQFDGYLKTNDLAAEDVNLLLGVGATLRRGDWQGFLDGVMPYVTAARQHLGIEVTPDLQTKVDAGEMTIEAAQELTASRMETSRLTAQAKTQAETDKQRQQRDTNAQVAATINAAVDTWEQGIKSRDPDYARKVATVKRVSQALIAQHGQPMTDVAAIALAQRAYDETNEMFKGISPAPAPSRRTPVAANSASNGNMQAQPTTLMEAVRMAQERYHARA